VTAVQPAAPSAPTVQAPPAPAPPAPVAAPPAGVVLPNGGTLDVAPDSPEAAFAHDLADSSVVLPRSFQFDDLSFSSRSAALGADADKTMDAVAATLNAYPSARVRIEGHSGNVGSPAANRALAAARARAVKDMLVARGVAPNRIDTPTGRGMVPPGRAEAGPRTNRRAEIVLLNR
jgi:outer membrane protein OmpA-like peptidoglycan-associated protein